MTTTFLHPDVTGPRRHRNSERMVQAADPVWEAAQHHRLIGMTVDVVPGNRLEVRETGHTFVNMCSTSYLGLNTHPALLDGAVAGLRRAGTTGLMTSNTRIRHGLMADLQDSLEDLWDGPMLLGASCTALSAGILPLLASGHLTDGEPRAVVFDRFAHFSMAYVKSIVAEEAEVLVAPHNDIDYLEDVCRRYPRVAYVADGAYSMGGAAPVDELRRLQERYGLFLFLDDSHSLSIVGECGQGVARAALEPNPLTIMVSSLYKGFGASGGVAMLGRRELAGVLARHGGPIGWSQGMSLTSVGAALASADIHRGDELARLQAALRRNITHFDRELPTPLAGNGLAVRMITVGSAERAVRLSADLFDHGWYCSAVFFPIVAQGSAGVRVMLRADLTDEDMVRFTDTVRMLLAAD